MSELAVQSLTPDFSVAGQLSPEAMALAAQAGFKSVINNRPDFEGGPAQPTSASIEAAARAAGLAYAYLPVQGAFQSEQEEPAPVSRLVAVRQRRRARGARIGRLHLAQRQLHTEVPADRVHA